MRIILIIVVLAEASILFGCQQSDVDCDQGSPESGMESEAVVSNALCDNSDGIRLAAQFGGSGRITPGSAVLVQNGFDFLVVDGHCRYWVQERAHGDVREGQLSNEESIQIFGSLRLDEWSSLAKTYQSSLCDGPFHSYRFGSERIVITPACHATRTDMPVEFIRPAIRELITKLHFSGKPVQGAVRFTLVLNDEAEYPRTSEAFRGAVRWPLESDPRALTVREAANFYGPFQLAQPPSSACLRKVATMFRVGTVGDKYAGFAPVFAPNGELLRLYVRDAIPIEDQNGIWIP